MFRRSGGLQVVGGSKQLDGSPSLGGGIPALMGKQMCCSVHGKPGCLMCVSHMLICSWQTLFFSYFKLVPAHVGILEQGQQ